MKWAVFCACVNNVDRVYCKGQEHGVVGVGVLHPFSFLTKIMVAGCCILSHNTIVLGRFLEKRRMHHEKWHFYGW